MDGLYSDDTSKPASFDSDGRSILSLTSARHPLRRPGERPRRRQQKSRYSHRTRTAAPRAPPRHVPGKHWRPLFLCAALAAFASENAFWDTPPRDAKGGKMRALSRRRAARRL
ncbi:hypothetical protein EVAR_19327_1 [Eumeta japonica]|uniref:Uncharacterized protein n=1 Tax=Eumeta variegata TaxID=151549 RepID=A0A4C1TRC5_EUMVA|nr:hypothetical protein EVAR_19327_1 [Eumeta japonica]